MVAPGAGDVEVGGGKTFLLEADTLDQGEGAGVGGLDVRLQPVQAQGGEGVGGGEFEAGCRQPGAGEGGVGVEAGIGGTEIAIENLRKIDDAGERAGGAAADEKAGIGGGLQGGEPGVEAGLVCERLGKRGVEGFAGEVGGDELGGVGGADGVEGDEWHGGSMT